MPRLADSANGAIYDAARRFVENCLVRDGALFDDRPIWTRENLAAVLERLTRPTGGDWLSSFRGAEPEIIQLYAEAYYTRCLAHQSSDYLPETKRSHVAAIVELAPNVRGVPSDLDSAFAAGALNLRGNAVSTDRIVRLACNLKALPEAERTSVVADPWRLKTELAGVGATSGSAGRRADGAGSALSHALLHLVFPDTFEAIASTEDKATIAEHFARLVPADETDVDRKLIAIREGLTSERGSFDRFYDPPIVARWASAAAAEASESDDSLDTDEAAPAAIAPPVRAWLFQGNPRVWPGLMARLQAIKPGEVEPWRVTSHAADMHVGDRAVLWVAGQQGGVFAFGEIERPPYSHDLEPWERINLASSAKGTAVDIRITIPLAEPISRATIEAQSSLRYLGVLGIAQHRNYALTDNQWKALTDLVGPIGPDPVPVPEIPAPDPYVEPSLADIIAHIKNTAKMRLSDDVIRRYHDGLHLSGKFVILTGISGTGKTWLAEEYARAVGATLRTVPVAPNWTDNGDLLGYFSPLDHTYHDTETSNFLRDAARDQAHAEARGVRPTPYHLILDEMNLARVEHYFARILSVMERRRRNDTAEIELARDDRVTLGPNLFVIGTVNVDETTHGFADKVYDRAQLIELTIGPDDVEAHMAAVLKDGRPRIPDPECQRVLLAVWNAVESVAPFAYRVVDEIGEYLRRAGAHGDAVTWQKALDEQLVQKVLPKLKGEQTRFEGPLKELRKALEGDAKVPETYRLTAAKIDRMLEDLGARGFTSYF